MKFKVFQSTEKRLLESSVAEFLASNPDIKIVSNNLAVGSNDLGATTIVHSLYYVVTDRTPLEAD